MSVTDPITVFLVSVTKSDDLQIKLGDFGLAVDLRGGPAKTWTGTGDFIDPVSISTFIAATSAHTLNRKLWKEIRESIGLLKVTYILLDVRWIRHAVLRHY